MAAKRWPRRTTTRRMAAIAVLALIVAVVSLIPRSRSIVASLESPAAVRGWPETGLRLADGRAWQLPDFPKRPATSSVLAEVTRRGIEVGRDGRVAGRAMSARAGRTLGALPLLVALGPGPGPESARVPPAPLESRPDSIRAWIAADPGVRLDPGQLEALGASWRGLIRRFAGGAWDVEVAAGEGPLAGTALEAVTAEAVAPAAAGCDKAWLIRIEPAGSGYALAGREFDATLGLLGPVRRRPAPSVRDAPRDLYRLALEVFAPLAEIGPSSAGGVTVTVRAAVPAAAGPDAGRVAVGATFRPYEIGFRPDVSVQRVREIPFTYLRVEGRDGATARCRIVSALRDPLTRQVAGGYRRVALGVRPHAEPTRLRFVTEPDGGPAAGYLLTARAVPDGPARAVGTTDREGRIVLPAGFADDLVVLRLLAGAAEPLVEFPALPGEAPEERTLPVIPKPLPVAFLARLDALRDEIVDLIARRAALEVRLRARVDGAAWDDVRALRDEYRRLPARSDLERRLAHLEGEAARRQAETKAPVLTRTVRAHLADTAALIARYLDDAPFQAAAEALERAQSAEKTSSQRSQR